MSKEIKMSYDEFRAMEISIEKKQQFIDEWCKSDKVVLIDKSYEGTKERSGVPVIIAHDDAVGNFLEAKFDAISKACNEVMELNRKYVLDILALQKEIEQLKKKKSWF